MDPVIEVEVVSDVEVLSVTLVELESEVDCVMLVELLTEIEVDCVTDVEELVEEVVEVLVVVMFPLNRSCPALYSAYHWLAHTHRSHARGSHIMPWNGNNASLS